LIRKAGPTALVTDSQDAVQGQIPVVRLITDTDRGAQRHQLLRTSQFEVDVDKYMPQYNSIEFKLFTSLGSVT